MKPLIAFLLLCTATFAVDYPVVYVAIPRDPDVKPQLQDVENILGKDPGAHLRVVHPDGTDRVLWSPPDEHGAVMDPQVSLDGEKVYFAYQADAREVKFRFQPPINLYELTVATGAVRQLTFSTEPGDYNTGPCEVPGGRLIYTSSINHLSPVSQHSGSGAHWNAVFQLFALKLDDPANTVEQVGYLNLRGALHPELLMDGRIMWSSHENHGYRRDKLWGLWASYPDGRHWEPLWSAFGRVPTELASLHFQSQTRNGRVQLVYYYPIKSSGHGNIFDFLPGEGFGSPDRTKNPVLADSGFAVRFPFQPVSNNAPFSTEPVTRSLTPWGTGKDSGNWSAGYPSGAPDGLLMTMAYLERDPGKGNATRRIRECGVYLIPDAEPSGREHLTLIVDSPDHFEVQPRALLSWKARYGVDPVEHPWLPDAAGKDYGYVGSSGVYSRETAMTLNSLTDTDLVQGADTCVYTNADIEAIRIVYQQGTPRGYRPATHWEATGVERMGVLGEIPLRKFNPDGSPVLDARGDPDTSFLAQIPADTSFAFQLLDKHGRALTMPNTWRQVRPGETRTDCRGCHAHHVPGIEFDGTYASRPEYKAPDLTDSLKFVEWFRDVKPILDRHCVECHGEDAAEAAFVITDTLHRNTTYVNGLRSTQSRLVDAVLGKIEGIDRMPKGKPPLSDAEIRTLATWIDLGAPVDRGAYWQDLRPESTPDAGGNGDDLISAEHQRLLTLLGEARRHLNSDDVPTGDVEALRQWLLRGRDILNQAETR